MRARAVLAAAVLAAAACGPSEEELTQAASGRRLYRREGCVACHGLDLGGTAMAPTLDHVARHWSRDDLAKFLADPEPWVARDGRLRRLRQAHPTSMRGFPYLSDAERRDLAVFLTSR